MHNFIHLHTHTHYSLLDGQSKVADLVQHAVADGMRGMAITDHGNMFGVKDLFDECNKINKQLKKEVFADKSSQASTPRESAG